MAGDPLIVILLDCITQFRTKRSVKSVICVRWPVKKFHSGSTTAGRGDLVSEMCPAFDLSLWLVFRHLLLASLQLWNGNFDWCIDVDGQ